MRGHVSGHIHFLVPLRILSLLGTEGEGKGRKRESKGGGKGERKERLLRLYGLNAERRDSEHFSPISAVDSRPLKRETNEGAGE